MNSSNKLLNTQSFAERIGYSIDELREYRKNKYHNCKKTIIPKKEKRRLIVIPNENYKSLLRAIDKELKRFHLPDYFYGSTKNCCAIDCALVHLNNPIILKIDLENFFPNTNYHRVYNTINHLYNDNDLAKLLTELCTFEYRLPQGFPTSPTIAENALLPLARRIWGFCKQYKLKLSIYIDDIIISGGMKLIEHENKILSIFDNMKFKINKQKLSISSSSDGVDVTGVYLKDGKATTKPKFNDEVEQLLQEIKSMNYDTGFDVSLQRELKNKLQWRNQINKKYHNLNSVSN